MAINNIPSIVKEFLILCKTELELDQLPKIIWLTQPSNFKSFGSFNPNDGSIRLVIVNRQILDSLRTLAHEIVHYRQWTRDELQPDSGETGSEQENEANSLAAVIMRKFGRSHPELFKMEPIAKSLIGRAIGGLSFFPEYNQLVVL